MVRLEGPLAEELKAASRPLLRLLAEDLVLDMYDGTAFFLPVLGSCSA